MWIRKVERDRRKGVISPVPTQMLSNEEFIPRPQNERQKHVEHLIGEMSTEKSKKLGMDRRDFMSTSMGLATCFAAIGTGMITDARRRNEVVARLQRSGRDIVHLSNAQIDSFAGNAIELQGKESRILALSTTALAALGDDQRATIEAAARIVALDIPTIERAGGSVRCTLAGIHLTPRN